MDDSTGYVFIADEEQGVVDVLNPVHVLEETYEGQIIGTIGPLGEPEPFGERKLSTEGLSGIAINQTNNQEYILDGLATSRDAVDVFGPPVRLPTLTVNLPSNIEPTGATLSGTVNPEGTDASNARFEYGPGSCQSFGFQIPGAPNDAGEGKSPVPVTANLEGLLAGSEYCYRVAVTDVLGEVPPSPDQRLVTAPAIGGESVSNVSQFAATVHAGIEPGEIPTTYHFVYGATSAYGSLAPDPDTSLPVARGENQVSQAITGLQAGTTYHYAVVASSPAGTYTGPDETFTTPPVPAPAVATGGAGGITVGAATLTGTIDPEGWDTTYAFEYGTSAAYGASWPTVPVNLGALNGGQRVSITVENLLPGTTYHYRLVASNGGGTSYGADATFTTGEYPSSVIKEAPVAGTIYLPSTKPAKPKPKPKHKPAKHKRKKVKAGSKGAKRGRKATRGRRR